MTGYGDYGGFGGSKTVWQLIGTFNYQWTPKATAFAGWSPTSPSKSRRAA